MMRSFLFGVFIFSTIVSHCFAQTSVRKDQFEGFRQAVSILPQYVSISGIRIDYERKLNSRNQWILIGPQYYADKNGYDVYDDLSGWGINSYFKVFVSDSEKKNLNGLSRTNLYFSVGPTCQHFKLTSVEEVPEEFTENGTTYIQFNPREVDTKIYKIGANADFGIQLAFDEFILDLYFGAGIRFALDKDGDTFDYFNDYWTDFGYSGFLLDGGIRFGFLIP